MKKVAGWLLALALLAPLAGLAQTGGVRIGTAGTPDAAAALDVAASGKGLLIPRMDSATRAQIAAPVPAGLLVYQTNGRTGFWYYTGSAWAFIPDKVRSGDNLGNHRATLDVNLNGHRLLHPDGSALGDSVGHVEINGQVNDASVSLITRSQNGVVRKYSRVMLSGYGKLPDGNPDNNDYGLWATAYRERAWAGFFSAGNTKAPLRFVGICQNPGYDGTGSAIRIVDGTQGAGKVLTSNANGYGTWQTPAPTAAGGNFDLGPNYLVGNGGSTGLSVSNSGQLGVGVTGPFGRLSNSTSNLVASDTYGGSTNSLNWQVNQSAYGALVYNAGTAASAGGLAVKIANSATAGALDISRGSTATGAGTPLFRVGGNGYVGIGTNNPFSQLANSPDNMLGSEGAGGNPGSLNWQANQQGYTAMLFNAGTFGNSGALALKVANNTTAGALDVSRSADAGTAGTSLFRVNGNGYVGIGTNNPGAPLEVTTLGTYGTGNYAYGYLLSTGQVGTFTGPLTNTSIRAAGRVVAAEFNALSDARLKRVLGVSSGAADLALLTKLRITDYQMRDQVRFGAQQFKKVIAQEVEAVYPQAVTRMTGFLPDVYARASAAQLLPGDSLLALTLPAGLPAVTVAGQRVKLVGPAGEVVAVLAAPVAAGSRTLTVRGVSSLAGQPVFVFGLEHADVRAVDYEALAMLNVSATQELARQVEALQQRNAALEARANTADTQAAQAETDHAALLRLQAQVAQLLSGQPAAQASR